MLGPRSFASSAFVWDLDLHVAFLDSLEMNDLKYKHGIHHDGGLFCCCIASFGTDNHFMILLSLWSVLAVGGLFPLFAELY